MSNGIRNNGFCRINRFSLICWFEDKRDLWIENNPKGVMQNG